jgi:hypothetical protein
MDGIDVSGFQCGRVYRVAPDVAKYLVVAGYGRQVVELHLAADTPRRRGRK